MSELSNLIKISSKDIGIAFDKSKIQENFISLSKSQKALKEIIETFNYRNGFMAFESALHFFHFSEGQKKIITLFGGIIQKFGKVHIKVIE